MAEPNRYRCMVYRENDGFVEVWDSPALEPLANKPASAGELTLALIDREKKPIQDFLDDWKSYNAFTSWRVVDSLSEPL